MLFLRDRSIREAVSLSGAVLFAVGLFTGLWSGVTASGMVQVPVPHLALAAHLNALFGGFWLISLGATFEFLRYSDSQKRRLAYLVAIPSWGNWAITLLASVLGVKGLGFNSDPANNFVAVLLQVVVVIPSLIAGVYWVRGFFVSPRTAHI